MKKFKLFLLLLLFYSPLFGKSQEKILICGPAKNIGPAVRNMIQNVEALGDCFADYAVIIYQNNSFDSTNQYLLSWSLRNKKVVYRSENLSRSTLPLSRMECIAMARNRVLAIAKDPKYSDFKYLVMADLDFLCRWPIEEIVKTIETPGDWDCVAANGIVSKEEPFHYDRMALRCAKSPLGPEVLGDGWWSDLSERIYFDVASDEWVPVYSAFAGLAVYKTASILGSTYSGTVTDDLEMYYKQIMKEMPQNSPQIQKYLALNQITGANEIPIFFQQNTCWENSWPDKKSDRPLCCEHLTLHAAMARSGYGKIFINPKMILIPTELYHGK